MNAMSSDRPEYSRIFDRTPYLDTNRTSYLGTNRVPMSVSEAEEKFNCASQALNERNISSVDDSNLREYI